MSRSIGGQSRVYQPVSLGPMGRRARLLAPVVNPCVTESFDKADGLGWDFDTEWVDLDAYFSGTHSYGTSDGQAGTATGYAQAKTANDVAYDDMVVSVTVTQVYYDYVDIILGARVAHDVYFPGDPNPYPTYFFCEFSFFGDGLPRYDLLDVEIPPVTQIWFDMQTENDRYFYRMDDAPGGLGPIPTVQVGDRLAFEVTGPQNNIYMRAFINDTVVAEGNYTQILADEFYVTVDDDPPPTGRSASVEIIDGNPYVEYAPAYSTLIDNFSVCPATAP